MPDPFADLWQASPPGQSFGQSDPFVDIWKTKTGPAIQQPLTPAQQVPSPPPGAPQVEPNAQGEFVSGMVGPWAASHAGAGLMWLGQKLGIRAEPADYGADLSAYQQSYKKAEAENPMTSAIAQLGGEVVSSVIPASKAAQLVEKLPQGLGIIRTALAGAAGGLAAGQTQTALQEGRLMTPQEAGLSAVIGSSGQLLSNAILPGVAAGKVSQGVADKVAGLRRIGIEPLPYQVSPDKAIQDASARLGVVGGKEQIEPLTKRTLALVGSNANRADPTVVQTIQQDLGAKLDNFQNKVGPFGDQQMMGEFNYFDQQARASLTDEQYRKVMHPLIGSNSTGNVDPNSIIGRIMMGRFDGPAFRQAVSSVGALKTLMKDPQLGGFGLAAKKILDDGIERAALSGQAGLTPQDLLDYRDTLKQYANWKSVSKVLQQAQGTDGLVSPSALAKTAANPKTSAEIKDLGNAASLLGDLRPTAQGDVNSTIKGAVPRPLWSVMLRNLGGRLGEIGGAAGVAGGTALATHALENVGAPGVAGVGAGAAVLASLIRDATLKSTLKSPELVNRLVTGRSGQVFGTELANKLTVPIGVGLYRKGFDEDSQQ